MCVSRAGDESRLVGFVLLLIIQTATCGFSQMRAHADAIVYATDSNLIGYETMNHKI